MTTTCCVVCVCFTVMGVRRAEYVVWNEASRARDGGARPHRMSDD